MKAILKSIILIALFIIYHQIVFAQNLDKAVTITASGSGKTLEDAKQAALRSTTEQAFGAFISSKTEMFNDQVVADQMASVSSGNIKSFSILNESQLPDGSWGVTLKAVVSVDKLTSFVEAKGIAIEIKGGIFAVNIKQQLLNEQGEIEAISEMVGLLHEPMQISFDYTIKSSEPKSMDNESKNWAIPLIVTSTANSNMDFCANYCIKTLAALTLSSEEVANYKSLNKAIFPFLINYSGSTKTFYLRNQRSINLLNTLIRQWEFYIRLFSVQSGIVESIVKWEGQIYNYTSTRGHEYESNIINFLTKGQKAGTFSRDDIKTLTQIEKMTAYTVKPTGVVSQFKHGGFLVYENDGHGLVAAITDLGEMNLNDAKVKCDELIFNGYNDWRLPTSEELFLLFIKLSKLGIGAFREKMYWSSTYDKGYRQVFTKYFVDGQEYYYEPNSVYFSVRPVRAF